MKIRGKTAAEIFESVRAQISAGASATDEVLPPVRILAAELKVNRNTVAAAYRKLALAGIVETGGRRGTVIRKQRATPLDHEGLGSDSRLFDLASGNPNPDWIPDISQLLPALEKRPRLYGEDAVDGRLEKIGLSWFEGICPKPFELDLTNGAVDAIERLAATQLLPSDTVAVEDPCFLGSINAIKFSGARIAGVPVDSEGITLARLEQVLAEGARAVLITPRAHNPTGCSLTAKRSAELRRLFERCPDVFVIIDDHFALLSQADYYSVLPQNCQRWAIIRSVSKAYGPDLRLAFVASDKLTSERLRRRLNAGSSWVSHILQDLARHCFEDKRVGQLVTHAKASYLRRQTSFTSKLSQLGIEGINPASDGLNVWIPLKGNSAAIALTLASRGWLVRTGNAFAVESPAEAIRITISNLGNEQEDQLVSDLRHCLGLQGCQTQNTR